MKYLYVAYPKCTTCQRAKKWLDDHQIDYGERHIKEDRPTAAELKLWHERSGLPLKKFFNTSGQVYRALGLSDKLADMTDAELYELLATDGMLVKRPIVVGEDRVLVGFKPESWERLKP